MDKHNLVKVLKSIDLTNLDFNCSEQDIDALCEASATEFGNVASVCVWPRFVRKAKRLLQKSNVSVCTVVNFPNGTNENKEIEIAIKQILQDGADEVDFVIPYMALLEGKESQVLKVANFVLEEISKSKKYICTKAIIESGILARPAVIQKATELILSTNVDFIKTSTGKVNVNATLESAAIISDTIAASEKKNTVGVKVAGGIKKISSALEYIQIFEDRLGIDSPVSKRFRIGASSLLSSVLEELSKHNSAGP